MIATLSFKISGEAAVIRRRTREWMLMMNTNMNQEVDGITLCELGCRHERISLATLKRRQLDRILPKSKKP